MSSNANRIDQGPSSAQHRGVICPEKLQQDILGSLGDAMDLLAILDEAAAALKAPLGEDDRSRGWTDDLRREVREEISISRSVLRRHGSGLVRYLRPRLDEWMEGEEIRPGRLQHLVSDVQRRCVDAHSTV
ncbi:hypothetical protein ACFRCI_18835 [Streptomyces sp. NPDC056638]|uniref:hypothetical protein n=1 Tax=Streptomyces sp. NPDC056638 TaxID=3345887 RepID=UPI0036A8DFB9